MHRKVTEAQRKIAAILAQLEADTDMVVDGLSLDVQDVTQVGGEKMAWICDVQINLRQLVDRRWNV